VGVRIPPPLPIPPWGSHQTKPCSKRSFQELDMAEQMTVTQRAASWPAEVKNYFEELQLEMKRVTWPPWKQVQATTAVVIFAVFGFAAYFFVVDNVVARLIQKLYDTFAK
jgi:preprotein translocase subunit SecE